MLRQFVTGGAGGFEPNAQGGGFGRIGIVPKNSFTFNVPAGSSSEMTLAQFLDTVGLVSGVLEVRVHAKTMATAGQSVTVGVYNVGYDPDNPNASFIASSASGSITISDDATETAPLLKIASLTTPITGLVRVKLTASQPAGGSGTFACTISVDIIARPA
ncbi:MAG: hypothetical protein HY744_10075 [Deltaproteobacteria bacterium]|nr:hypothetical protein [Deltaproteobacteria bacterium]